ncbi:hypothetical protein [Vibrio sp. V15_P4S5T153]|uniref:hypothetical protein n=2 Tax=unclassified Vibrio TaxID=2614977 RepID=UPI000B9032A2|nr:hypothetical protein [Vibrio sp. V15_P4S5T153]OXX64809.1 hypothetical protein B9J89_02755 [Vibrio sp. V15_P4S5T153]
MNKYCEAWAEKLGIEIAEYMGAGDNGIAFKTSDDKVMKITGDVGEFLHAHNLKGKSLKHFVEIYDTRIFLDGSMGILMEKLEICEELKEQFKTLCSIAKSKNMGIEEVDIDEDEYFDSIYDLQQNIADLFTEDHKNRLFSSDLHHDNIGLKEDGTIAVFDMRYDEHILRKLDIETELNKIKHEQYHSLHQDRSYVIER